MFDFDLLTGMSYVIRSFQHGKSLGSTGYEGHKDVETPDGCDPQSSEELLFCQLPSLS